MQRGRVCKQKWAWGGLAAVWLSGCLMSNSSSELAPGTEAISVDTAGVDVADAPAADPSSASGGAGATIGAIDVVTTAPMAGAQSNVIVDPRYPWALVGRFDLTDPNAPKFGLPNSRIGVRFTGTSLAVKFADGGATPDSGYDTFDVNIDGVDYAATANQFLTTPGTPAPCVPQAQVPLVDGNNFPGCLLLTRSADMNVPTTYPIAQNLDPNIEHVAWLTKRTEFYQGRVGTVKMFGFVLDDGATLLAPPPYLRRRIEVVGDSSTAGYGSAQRSACSYSERNSDGAIAIPAYLARYLRAEVVNLSSSGQGVYRSVYDKNTQHNLPVLYRAALPLQSPAYDFNRDHVDVVVLSAGGDDLWGNAGAGYFNNNDATVTTSARDNFVAAYTAWLTEIRSVRKDATIVCALSYAAFNQDIVTLGSALQDAVAARNNAGDTNVLYYTWFPANDPNRNPKGYASINDAASPLGLPYGCSGHPQPKMSQYLAGLLAPVIAQKMGWTDVAP